MPSESSTHVSTLYLSSVWIRFSKKDERAIIDRTPVFIILGPANSGIEVIILRTFFVASWLFILLITPGARSFVIFFVPVFFVSVTVSSFIPHYCSGSKLFVRKGGLGIKLRMTQNIKRYDIATALSSSLLTEKVVTGETSSTCHSVT